MRKENGEFTYRWNPNQDGSNLPILKITKSSLGTYGFCPASYNYSYIEGVTQKTSDAMIKGSRIHDGEENFLLSDYIKNNLNTLKIGSICFDNLFIDIGTPEDLERAKNILKNYK